MVDLNASFLSSARRVTKHCHDLINLVMICLCFDQNFVVQSLENHLGLMSGISITSGSMLD